MEVSWRCHPERGPSPAWRDDGPSRRTPISTTDRVAWESSPVLFCILPFAFCIRLGGNLSLPLASKMIAMPTPRRLRTVSALLLAAACLLPAARAQEGPLDPSPPRGITPDQIIQKFAARERDFKIARDAYTYRQDFTVQALDGSTVQGELRQVVDILFDDRGRRMENVVFAPQPTLDKGGLVMSREDFDDLEKRLPFVLTSDEIADYNILYVGQQQQDDLHTYVFDVAPRAIEKKRRYFEGRIWVDDLDFQIVKTSGKNVPDYRKGQENLFPKFVTWREQVDGRYWFPTYTRADDTLHFKSGDIRIRIIVKYTDYKRFGAKTRVTYEGQEIQKGEPDQKAPKQEPPK